MPRAPNAAFLAAALRAQSEAPGAQQVECTLTTFLGLRAIRHIVKVPQEPSGSAYVGTFLLPFRAFSYVIKVQSAEHGLTGIREAVLLDEAVAKGTVTIDPLAAFPIKRDWALDREEFDVRFPKHPVSRLRAHMRGLEAYARIDDAIRMYPSFDLPPAV